MKLGTDISHWQDKPDTFKEINFNQMKLAGAEFVIFKVSEEKTTDRVYTISWDDAEGILPRGGYNYLNYNIPGLEHAKYFCEELSKNTLPELCIAVDFECRINIPDNANAHLWNWLQYVEEQLHIIPWIYTSPSYWKEFGSKNIAWKKYPLWIANYRVNKPFIPKPWDESDCVCWQFTSKGDGKLFGAESLQIDLNQLYIDLPQQPPQVIPTHDQKVEILWKKAEEVGWI